MCSVQCLQVRPNNRGIFKQRPYIGAIRPNKDGRDIEVDVVELQVQADASMPASNNNVNSHYIL